MCSLARVLQVGGGKNWETPEGIDFQTLKDDVKKAVEVLAQAETAPRSQSLCLCVAFLRAAAVQNPLAHVFRYVHWTRSKERAFNLRSQIVCCLVQASLDPMSSARVKVAAS